MLENMKILEEDLEVTEKWLIKTGYIDKEETIDEADDDYISRTSVFKLLQESTADLSKPSDFIKLAFEIARLPGILKPPKIQQSTWYIGGEKWKVPVIINMKGGVT